MRRPLPAIGVGVVAGLLVQILAALGATNSGGSRWVVITGVVATATIATMATGLVLEGARARVSRFLLCVVSPAMLLAVLAPQLAVLAGPDPVSVVTRVGCWVGGGLLGMGLAWRMSDPREQGTSRTPDVYVR